LSGKAVTVKLAETDSPLGLPVTLIVYRPLVTFATIKEAATFPFEIAQFAELTRSPVSVQFESVEGNPAPVIVTPAPGGAEVSFRDNERDALVTVNVCEAQSPSGVPVTVIV
jgi:hypothetical protein